MYVYICIYTHMCAYVYIYIYVLSHNVEKVVKRLREARKLLQLRTTLHVSVDFQD